MGMYDYIVCDYELPGTPPAFASESGHSFQTKDLDCVMSTYTIKGDGSFSESDFTGTIEFYSSNIVGGGPGVYTRDGEDAESVCYEAVIVDGKLTFIVETGSQRKPALPSKLQSARIFSKPPNQEEIDERKKQIAESKIDKRIYVLWGGKDVGYWATVVVEDDSELCLRRDEKSEYGETLELINRGYLNHIYWYSEKEAMDSHNDKNESWNAGAKQYNDYAMQWLAGHGINIPKTINDDNLSVVCSRLDSVRDNIKAISDSGKFFVLDAMFCVLTVDEYTTDILIEILKVTLPWKSKLSNRISFLIAVEECIEQRGEMKEDAGFNGLE